MRAINVQIPRARRVLDFGCGTGWVIAEAPADGAPFRVGVDYSASAVQQAKGHQGVVFAVADGLRLPFAAETFDVVIGHVSMPYMNTLGALREIYRVLTPGGSLFLTFHNFYYLRRRFLESVRHLRWKDVIFCVYIAANAALNHFSLPQTQAWWRRDLFETVNTARGVHQAACRSGFIQVATEYSVRRIFFAATAQKPNPETGVVRPQVGWSVYGTLV